LDFFNLADYFELQKAYSFALVSFETSSSSPFEWERRKGNTFKLLLDSDDNHMHMDQARFGFIWF